jgi:hypothetical protein
MNMDSQRPTCPICAQECSLLDVVDFNKSCAEPGGKFLALAGIPVYYTICQGCNFCFSPELCKWTLRDFEEKIYNDEYVLVDPDYLEARPKANAAGLLSAFPRLDPAVRHLDYGGGNGALVKRLLDANWASTSYDPFVDRDTSVAQLGKFDLITAFEVFEHAPDVQHLMSTLRTLLSVDGLIFFSTLLSDGNIRPNHRINWWYASPRNGHISLFSKTSLTILAKQHGFGFSSFSQGLHVLFTRVPTWASHVLRTI